MKNLYTFALLLFFTFSFAQSDVPGYFINNGGARVDCLIRDMNWKDNPTEFRYKSGSADSYTTADISKVQEFGLGDLRYVRAEVDIDQSSHQLKKLTQDRKPVFERQTVFLTLLVDGTAKLYYYRKEDMQRYFYSISGSPIEQLIYKPYLTEKSVMRYDYSYRMQLLTQVKCEDFNLKSVENLEYNHKQLVKYFDEVNACHGDEIPVRKEKERAKLNLKVIAGANSTSLNLMSPRSWVDHDFGNATSITFGAEFELVLPMNHKRWSVYAQPTYTTFSGEGVNVVLFVTNPEEKIEYTIKQLQVPLGVRHYFPLNDNMKIFVNGSLTWSLHLPDSGIEFERHDYEPFEDTLLTIGLGGGLTYGDFSGEIRYIPAQDISLERHSNYELGSNIMMMLKYKLF